MPLRCIHRSGEVALLFTLCATACFSEPPAPPGFAPLQLTSSSFSGAIPERYASCNGRPGISPALSWSAPPAATRTFALIVTDPDAPFGTFVHWLVWNLPPTARSLPEAIPAQPQLPGGALQGSNSYGNIGYVGPCPPGRSAHRYLFDLYALDTAISLAPGAQKKQLLEAMQGHILATGRLIGRYPH